MKHKFPLSMMVVYLSFMIVQDLLALFQGVFEEALKFQGRLFCFLLNCSKDSFYKLSLTLN